MSRMKPSAMGLCTYARQPGAPSALAGCVFMRSSGKDIARQLDLCRGICKRRVRLRGRGISRHPHPSAAADAPPFADQAPLSEQIALHGEPIEPAHVLWGKPGFFVAARPGDAHIERRPRSARDACGLLDRQRETSSMPAQRKISKNNPRVSGREPRIARLSAKNKKSPRLTIFFNTGAGT
jgi:hypothetical protein